MTDEKFEAIYTRVVRETTDEYQDWATFAHDEAYEISRNISVVGVDRVFDILFADLMRRYKGKVKK